jgi:hypothetical protein
MQEVQLVSAPLQQAWDALNLWNTHCSCKSKTGHDVHFPPLVWVKGLVSNNGLNLVNITVKAGT